MRFCHVLYAASILLLSLLLTTVVSATPLDFSGDGYSDIVFRRKLRNDGSWSYFSPRTGMQGSIAVFGRKKTVAIPGFWESLETPSLAVIETTGKKNSARHSWMIRKSTGGTGRINFGTGDVDFLSGADFNGNGYLDAAVVSSSGRVQILTDPFAPDIDPTVFSGITSQQFSQTGKKKLNHFFMRGTGGRARPAALNRVKTNGFPQYEFQLGNLAGVLSIATLPGPASRDPNQVLTLISDNGDETLLIIGDQSYLAEERRRRKEVTVISVSGRVLFRGKYSKKATITVGDYLDEAGEEFAVVMRKTILVVNPFSKSVRSFPGFPGEAIGDQLTPSERVTESAVKGPCDRFLPAPDGLNGFLAKNADHGGVVYLTPNGSYRNGRILHPKTLKEVSGTRYTGVANGGRGHFRIGGRLPFGEHVFSAETGNETHCWRIPDGMSRVD